MRSFLMKLALLVLGYLTLASAMAPIFKVRRLLANDTDSNQGPFTAATYNTALLDVPDRNMTEARERLWAALPSLVTDVLCINEAWDARDQQEIVAVMRNQFPFYLSAVNLSLPNSSPAACDGDQTQGLLTCGLAHCLTNLGNGSDLLACLRQNCNEEYNNVLNYGDCYNCLAFTMLANGINAGNVLSSLRTAQDTCSQPSTERRWDPNWGLLLLSTRPFTNTSATALPGYNRGYLTASIDAAFGSVQVTCTHLTTDILPFYIPPVGSNLTSFQQENSLQIDVLNAALNSSAAGTINQLLMGDFNTGPAWANLTEEWQANYFKLLGGGWQDAWFNHMTNATSACTWCAANNLTSLDATGSGGTENMAIDHVFFKGFAGFTNDTHRIFDGQPPLSDHYGVELILTPPTAGGNNNNNTSIVSSTGATTGTTGATMGSTGAAMSSTGATISSTGAAISSTGATTSSTGATGATMSSTGATGATMSSTGAGNGP